MRNPFDEDIEAVRGRLSDRARVHQIAFVVARMIAAQFLICNGPSPSDSSCAMGRST